MEKNNITCVPMQFSFDDNGYKENENVINIGATIGSHIGSDACGVVFVSY